MQRVDVWSDESSLALQGCFDSADWSAFQDFSDDIHELTDVVCSYIKFFKDTVIPSMEVKVYPNNKPQVSSELKNVISQRNAAFILGMCENGNYKDNIEIEFRINNPRVAWTGMREMTSYFGKWNTAVRLAGFNSDNELADSLNEP